MAAYGAFAAYAVAAAFLSGGRDRVWAIWAACGYAVALAMLWCWRSRRGQMAAVGVSVALAVLAPLLWLSVAYPLEDGMVVIDRSAALLLHHGSPYLAADQVTGWLSYNPYLPVMTLFGLPSAAGLGGLAGNSGVWIAIGTVIPLAAAFWIEMRPRGYDALLATAVAVASPVVGLNLAVITTDPPVLALILLALALAARPAAPPGTGRTSWITAITGSGAALGAACDLKSTAWLAVPVLAAMIAARDGVRAAGRFVAAVAVTAVVLDRRPRPRRAHLAARSERPRAEQRAVPARPHPRQDPGREPAARAPAHRARASRAPGLGRPAARGRARHRDLDSGPAASRRARGRLAAGRRPDADVPARTAGQVRLLHLPARPGRLAGADRR